MEAKKLLEEKFNNFKFLICEKIIKEDNEHFLTLMEYKLDDIVFFYETNIKPHYKIWGMDMVVSSFMAYLELDLKNEETKTSITKYFNFFVDVIDSIDGESKVDAEADKQIEEGQREWYECDTINEEIRCVQNDNLQ